MADLNRLCELAGFLGLVREAVTMNCTPEQAVQLIREAVERHDRQAAEEAYVTGYLDGLGNLKPQVVINPPEPLRVLPGGAP